MTCGGLFAAEIRSMSMTVECEMRLSSVAFDLYAGDRFSYEIPIAQASASSRFFMAVCSLKFLWSHVFLKARHPGGGGVSFVFKHEEDLRKTPEQHYCVRTNRPN